VASGFSRTSGASITWRPASTKQALAALHLSRLPDLHRDPFDRLLVSQAIVHGLTIVTPDALVTQYPARTIW
jgi:PIN domain nuclease of toxin-antitoxin system